MLNYCTIPLIQIKHKQKCKKRYLNQRPDCCKKFGKTSKLYWLLLIKINNDLKSVAIIKVKV